MAEAPDDRWSGLGRNVWISVAQWVGGIENRETSKGLLASYMRRWANQPVFKSHHF